MTTSDTIKSSIESRLAPMLHDYKRRLFRYEQPKVIRDVLWGFNRYEPYELALIDSPPFQRLRNLFQTSLALFTYPGSVHSRFEHSLGAAALASRMITAIRERAKHSDRRMELTARIATLLHDLGHGPFSHGSECFYEHLVDGATNQPIFGEAGLLAIQEPGLFSEASASEVLTYLLLTTPSFKDLWTTIVEMYKNIEPDLVGVDIERVASMILGIDKNVGDDARCYRQIVNGPFDADKLDYLPRDGYFTGLEINVDIERLLQTVTVITRNGKTDLGVVSSGATILEQVIFAKTQIYSSVYHHHKVRASLQLLQVLLQMMYDRGYKPSGQDLRDPASYLFLDDYDILRSHHGDTEIDSIVQRIKNRDLPKRALVITYPCFAETDQKSRDHFKKMDEGVFEGLAANVKGRLHLASDLVVFDSPSPPRLFGIAQAPVQIARGSDPLLLQDIFPSAAWGKAYAGYRRVTYVFTTAADRRSIGLAVRSALESMPKPVKLNDNSLALAKL